MPMKVTTLRLTERLWRLLDEQGRNEGTSASQLIREGAMMRIGYALGKRDRSALPANEAAPPWPGAFADFASGAEGALDLLHERVGFALWLVTRVEDGNWVVEHARDDAYGITAGDAFPFADTYCAQMVEGLGPRFAPEANAVPCYAAAGIGKELPVASYIGTPLLLGDRSLYGTLCAIDPAPKPPSTGDELPLVELSARFLSSLLESDAKDRRNEKLALDGVPAS
jgi:hypothetical protein